MLQSGKLRQGPVVAIRKGELPGWSPGPQAYGVSTCVLNE